MRFILVPVRWLLGQLIIFIDWLTRPRPMQRDGRAQAEVDEQTRSMALYQFRQCPFCVRTRRQIRRLGLNIETRDARNDPEWHRQLVEEGGKYQVPCLRISGKDGSVEWLYESVEINRYLQERFG